MKYEEKTNYLLDASETMVTFNLCQLPIIILPHNSKVSCKPHSFCWHLIALTSTSIVLSTTIKYLYPLYYSYVFSILYFAILPEPLEKQ
jgi:hypothetical protein